MAELARGTVADRPWGRTLGALGLKGLTGQLTLISDNRQYCIAFHHGAVVGATSPLPNDAAVRVALTGHLVTSTQVAEIARRQAASPGRDEIEVIAELARLVPEQTMRLRRRIVAQRAARTFSIDRGEFIVDDRIAIPVVPGSEIDIRALIYMGARQNLSEQRLAMELGQLGQWFLIKPDALDDLPQYGFGEAERSVIELLRIGADLGELELVAPNVEQRMVRAAVYALASCNACALEAVPRGRTETRQTRAGSQPGAPRITDRTPRMRFSTVEGPDAPRRGESIESFGSAGARSDSGRILSSQPTEVLARPSGSSPPDIHNRTTRPIERIDEPEAAPVRFKAVSGVPDATPSDDDLDVGRTRTQTDPAQRMRQLVDPPRDYTQPAEPRAQTTTRIPIPRTTSPNIPRTSSSEGGSGPVPSRTASTPTRSASPTGAPPPRTVSPTGGPVTARTSSGNSDRTPSPTSGARPSGHTSGPIRVPARARSESSIREIEKLVRERLELLDSSADHFTLLGISTTASPEQVRAAYYSLARQLHPDRLASLGYDDTDREAHRLFAQINAAFAVLSDAKRKKEYLGVLQRGGESAVAQEQAKADDVAKRAVAAEEAFRRGEMAMRRDQIPAAIEEFRKAIELDKDEADYHAMLAWAQFCAAPDKASVATETRLALERAIGRSSPKGVTAHFYLGRVERMLGRDQDALRHFMDVLSIAANHTEARSEIRAIQARIASNPTDKSKSLFKRNKPSSRR